MQSNGVMYVHIVSYSGARHLCNDISLGNTIPSSLLLILYELGLAFKTGDGI